MSFGRRYSVSTNQATTSSSNKTAGRVSSATTVRPRIYEFSVGTSGGSASGDNVLDLTLQTGSANGTDTAVTPFVIDPGDPAALAAGGSNATVEPTYTASSILWQMSINQRATYRWVAPPDGELVLAAVGTGTARFFAGMQVKSVGYTGITSYDFKYAE
jgi:hypothetical protein